MSLPRLWAFWGRRPGLRRVRRRGRVSILMTRITGVRSVVGGVNVLYFLRTFPKLSESFVLNEICELVEMGHDVAVFALHDPDEDFEHEEYAELDIPVRHAETLRYTDAADLLSTRVIHPRILRYASFNAPLKRHAVALSRSKQCIEFVDALDVDPDLVHTHFAAVETFPARYVASYYDVPFTVTAHAYDLYNDPDTDRLAHILRSADQVVTISEYNRRYIEREITDATPVDVVHAGVRPDKFEPQTPTVDSRILTVGRFVEKKGVSDAITAVAEIGDRFPHLEYHIVGSGPMEDEIRDLVTEYGLADTVELLGTVSDERLLTEFDEAACFLLPCVIDASGDRDGIPVVLMESMAMETPPISTTISGIPELIDEQRNGLLVEPGDTDGMADALTSLLADPDTRRAFGEAGREKVRREFNVEREAAKLASVFTRVCDRH